MDNLDGLKSAMIVEETVWGHTECLPVVFARRVATEDRLLVTMLKHILMDLFIFVKFVVKLSDLKTVYKATSLYITSKSDSLQ